MRAVIFVLACFAYTSHAQKVHSKESRTSLANLLLANEPAAAFTPSSPGARTGLAHATRSRARPTSMDDSAVAPTPDTPEEPAAAAAPKFDIKELAGVTGPLGFFDPVGFSSDVSEGRARFYREVELKHGRVGMLAALGFLVAEQFHPLFGGDIDAPSYVAFQQTPLQTFWPIVVLLISILEVFSVFSFNSPLGGEPWSIRSDHEPGNLGFDPLGLKPTDAKELKEMQTKELNNGRLAMLAAAGMIAQEFVSGQKLF